MNASKPNQQGILPRDLFAGKTVFVTGGGSGINLGIARTFAGLGANIGLCGRSQERLDAAAAGLREIGARISATSADVRMPDQLQSAMSASRDALGDIDVLICGAAGNFLVKGENLSFNGFKTVVDIDLVGSFNASRIAFEQLQRTRGSIIFITAPMAHLPHAYQAHVGPAKAGVEMLMKNLALEWGPYGIRSNSIIPGFVGDTEGMRRISSAEDRGNFVANIPLRRMGVTQEIGEAAAFLASPLASYITGTSLWVDGGQALSGSGFFNVNSAAFLANAAGA
ncbi:NAD(P)-dependent dehydrogenase (short-subunit alcohol dehydrogenase family) [Bradyrhizobium sp. AZCC 2262]|jgi:NAD(P)-dependent dehydrogenase (short-subunit alcohol dehydrogenase family)|uniref:SDR family oxidoreductase n=1 Tax=Bradyrhizobium sp. AZCC 2262 TaxID=3117022 RepID=UPI002FF0FA4B